MKRLLSKMTLCSVVTFGLSMFAACGEKNTTEVTEFTGLAEVESGKPMPECSNENDGEMVHVADSNAVFYCVAGSWQSLDGQNGTKDGKSCSAKVVAEGIEISCGGSVVDTLKNGASLKGETGYSCSISQNDQKTAVTVTCESANGPQSYTVSNGEPGASCEAEQTVDGNVKISCDGKEVGTLYNGKSAYEIAVDNGAEEQNEVDWLASLRADDCTIEDVKEDDNIVGYKVTCGDKDATVLNGKVGATGVGCTTADDGNGKVTITCGEGADKNEVTLFKAVCGTDGYDPAQKFCVGTKTYARCGTDKVSYDPENQYCFNDTRVEGKLIDKRDSQSPQVYETVTIGNQVWMAKNLNYNTNDEHEHDWCGGGNGSSYGDCNQYGRLYSWTVAQTACPDGWKLPSNDDWKTLFTAVGGEESKNPDDPYSWEYPGVQASLKESGYGFNPVYAGYRYYDPETKQVSFDGKFSVADFWTSSENGDEGFRAALRTSDKSGVIEHAVKDYAFSIRCIRK